MTLRFIVKQSPLPPGPEWVSIFDNTDWENSQNAAWSTDRWVLDLSAGTQAQLGELGTWVEGFRPTKIRVTFAGGYNDTATLEIAAGGEDPLIADVDNYVSGAEAALNFAGIDIWRLIVRRTEGPPAPDYEITNIEFYGG